MARKTEIRDRFTYDLGALVSDAQSLVGDVADAGGGPKLILNIDATHSGRLTNNRVYPGTKMKDSIATFMKPTPRPVLKNHQDSGDPIGRVRSANFIQLKQGEAFINDFKRPGSGVGSGFAQLELEIMDVDSIEKFLDGRFKEFSTRQAFDAFHCSFCGSDMMQEFCGHHPGETILVDAKKGKPKKFKVYGITGNLKYREVSTVNIPGDSYTKINEMELVGADALGTDGDLLFSCVDNNLHDLNELFLTDSTGEEIVKLVAEGDHTSVTSEDRRRLTGKSIIAVGPNFAINEIEEIAMTKKDNVVLDDETKNTDSDKTREEAVDPIDAEETKDESQEDVVVPEDKTKDSEADGNKTGLSDEEVRAGYKALAAQTSTLESKVTDQDSEIKRLKGQCAEKDKEIADLQEVGATAQADLKDSYSRMLLDARMILGKGDVSEIKTSEDYATKLVELGDRSLDSLKDSISDLTPELVSFKASRGIAGDLVEGKPVENPVVNANVEDKEDEEETKPKTRRQLLEDVI